MRIHQHLLYTIPIPKIELIAIDWIVFWAIFGDFWGWEPRLHYIADLANFRIWVFEQFLCMTSHCVGHRYRLEKVRDTPFQHSRTTLKIGPQLHLFLRNSSNFFLSEVRTIWKVAMMLWIFEPMLFCIYICPLLSWVCSDYLPTCVHNIFPTIMGAHLVSSQIQVLDDLPHFSTCIIDNKAQGTKKHKAQSCF